MNITYVSPTPVYPNTPNTPVNVNATLDWFVAQTLAVIPWLTDVNNKPCVFPNDPGAIYSGSKPYAVWIAPRVSVAPGLSGTIGNIRGEPNKYVCSYRETVFEGKTNTSLEQRRTYDTFSILASYLCPANQQNAPCPPDGVAILDISLEHEIPSVYIQTPSGLFVGALFIVQVTEEYT